MPKAKRQGDKPKQTQRREPPESVRQLIEFYETNADDYQSGTFNEAQTRQQFLDPLFEALGWDVANRQGFAEQYKEVIHEDSLEVAGRKKAPDYCFRIGRERKFFVEAKKPATDITSDKRAAYQLRRYAWSAKLPLSILTNFRHLAIYDARIKPKEGDAAKTARIRLFDYKHLVAEWTFLSDTFSKQGIQKGAFDRFAVTSKTKRGAIEVDDDFLDTIETWRADLARDLFKRDHALDAKQLNYLAQVTIDRILFLRICEDRGLEPLGHLETALKGGGSHYKKLLGLFDEAQARYNSGLFYLIRETQGEGYPDTLSGSVEVSNGIIKEIVENLYFPRSPYEFSVFAADVLGQVYERFLGSQVVVGSRGVKVETKPEVKKAGGVYYTPSHIVRYITASTVQSALAGYKGTTRPRLRVLDMACGSGSFLIEAYQTLLDWYRNWHETRGVTKRGVLLKVPRKHRAGFDLHLSIHERKRILLDHIFGVDIDPQAVEVAKLSLLLKVIEDPEVVPRQMELSEFKKRLLPSLSANIKCGNSLVERDFDAVTKLVLTDEEQQRVNAFDWAGSDGFKAVMSDGGFDIIIGNPPYSYRNATLDKLKPYYTATYRCAEGNFDTYKFFMERAVGLIRPGGTFGQIVNASFLIQPQFQKLREVLDRSLLIREIDPLGSNVFRDVTIDTTIFIAERRKDGARGRQPVSAILVREPARPEALADERGYRISQRRFASNDDYVFDWRLSDDAHGFVERLLRQFDPLSTYCDFSVGINTGSMKEEMVADRKFDARYHRCVRGTGIARYGEVKTDGWIIYDPAFVRSYGARGRTLPPESFFLNPKILVVRTRNASLERRIVATLDLDANYNLNRLSNITAKENTSIHTILGVLNSSLVNWLFQTRFFNYEIKPVYLRKIPCPTEQDDDLDRLVGERVALEKQRANPMSPRQQEALERGIAAKETEIDQRVLKLFGVTKDERAFIRTPGPQREALQIEEDEQAGPEEETAAA